MKQSRKILETYKKHLVQKVGILKKHAKNIKGRQRLIKTAKIS
jgi:hypothetical protein